MLNFLTTLKEIFIAILVVIYTIVMWIIIFTIFFFEKVFKK